MNTFTKITRNERNEIIARAEKMLDDYFCSKIYITTENFTFHADVCKNRTLANACCYRSSDMTFISKEAHKRLVGAIN